MSAAQQQPYDSWSVPVWPKAHTLALKHPDAYQDTTSGGDAHLARQHHPLGAARDGTGRRAGTHSAWEHDGGEDNDSGPDRDDAALDSLRKRQVAQGWSDERVEEVKRKLLLISGEAGDDDKAEDAHALANGAPTPSERWSAQRDQALADLFASEDVVLTIREIKALIKDWSKADPEVGGSRRDDVPGLTIPSSCSSTTRCAM